MLDIPAQLNNCFKQTFELADLFASILRKDCRPHSILAQTRQESARSEILKNLRPFDFRRLATILLAGGQVDQQQL